MIDETLFQPEPVTPADRPADTAIILPFWPLMRKAQSLAPAGAQGRLPRTVPTSYVHRGTRLFVGPVLGAPAAVVLMEGLIAGGIRQVLVIGVCGSLSETIRIGDLILADRAYAAEGTSRHYFPERSIFNADGEAAQNLQRWLAGCNRGYHRGPLVSTDAPYRETAAFVQRYQAHGAIGIDMELSAVYALGEFRGVRTAGLMVVSDELAGGRWRSGFRDPLFRGRCDQLMIELMENGP